MHYWNGVAIIERPDPRRYGKLPADVCVPAAFRAEFDAWAAEFFQPDPGLNLLKDGEMVFLGHSVQMNPRTFAQLKKAVAS